jgi:hypothetical protein
MRNFAAVKVFLIICFFITLSDSFAQNFVSDTSSKTSFVDSAVAVYHRTLAPEPGLYNGSQYAYNAYYPFVINEGDPFFISKDFTNGTVFYNGVQYNNVTLLFDIIHEDLLTHDPAKIYILKLNADNVKWFKIWDHMFVRLKQDSGTNSPIHTGYYDVLYSGKISIYKKVQKIFKENSASSSGVNKYVVETDEYFIKKNNVYFSIKNKKSLLAVLDEKGKEVGKFMKKNRLKLKKNKDNDFAKVAAFYEGINN